MPELGRLRSCRGPFPSRCRSTGIRHLTATRWAPSSSSSCASSIPLPRSLTGAGVRETLAVLGRELPLEMSRRLRATPSSTGRSRANGRFAVVGSTGRTERASSTSPTRRCTSSATARPWIRRSPSRRYASTCSRIRRPRPRPVPHLVLGRALGLLHEPQPDGVPRAGRVPGGHRLDPRRRSLTYGEIRIPGTSEAEFLLSTYVCHPALANDNLSGVVLLWALARALSRQELRLHVRSVGAGDARTALLAGPQPHHARARAPRTRDLVRRRSGPAPVQAKPARRREVDRAAAYVLRARRAASSRSGARLGGDERQYCSPGFDLPVGTFSRTPHGLFPEYHSSADDLELVTAGSLGDSFRAALAIVDVDRDERPVPQPVAVRRAKARQARPVPERARRDEPGGRVPLGAEPLGRRARPPDDRRAVGLPYDRPRCGRDARGARPPRARARERSGAVVTGASRGIGRATASRWRGGLRPRLVARYRGRT